MNRKTNPSNNLSEIIESVLKIPFNSKQILRYKFSPKILHELSLAVQSYYKNYQIPNKELWELRPYISPAFTQGRELGLQYEFSQKHYSDNHKYSFDPDISGEMTRNIKKYLIYCHSLCIHDPLPYLLDFFRLDPNSEHSHALIPAVKSLLFEYSKLDKLIRSNILIPLSDEVFGFQKNNIIGKEELNYLEVKFPQIIGKEELHYLETRLPQIENLISKIVRLLSSTIRDEQYRAKKLEHKIDLFFPNQYYVKILKELLILSERNFTSNKIKEPFNVGILGNISAVNPDVLTVEDIFKIRSEEDLFAEWRSLLKRVFERLYLKGEEYNDLDGEFRELVRDELLQWKDKLSRKKKESSFISQMHVSTEEILIGITSGAIAGLTLGSTEALIGGVVAGGVSPAMKMVTDLIRTACNKPETLTLRHHFLSLGAKVDDN